MKIRFAAASLAALSVAIAAPITPAIAEAHMDASEASAGDLEELAVTFLILDSVAVGSVRAEVQAEGH